MFPIEGVYVLFDANEAAQINNGKMGYLDRWI